MSGDYDLVFVYQLSPVFMGLPGLIFARRNELPLLVYCCDLWPESLKVYIHSEKNFIFRYCKKQSKKLYCSANVLIAQSPSFKKYLIKTHNVDSKKLVYIPAFAEES